MEFRRYVPAEERRRNAQAEQARMRRRGKDVQPIHIEGREIARTFWGKAWCQHLESFSDFENRLPRGRTYVRNGSVCHLEIGPGTVRALVQGSTLYEVTIGVAPLGARAWGAIKEKCTGQISSLLDLLQGRLSSGVMAIVSDRDQGLFPKPREISLDCSCPDWASMCKHVAAALYGVGARLDEEPELLFLLRGVDHQELITSHAEAAVQATVTQGKARRIAEADLAEIFGLELDPAPAQAPAAPRRPSKKSGRKRKPSPKKRGRKRPKP